MLRRSVFPVVFGGCLIVFGWGFYNRKSWLCEVEATRQREQESYQKAQEFKTKLKEGLEKRRENGQVEEKANQVDSNYSTPLQM